jgi:LPPG:FO 2-phospho-L-lactate transferase
MTESRSGPVLALSGGIGGAKLALGVSHLIPDEQLIVVANTGDDFEHLGFSISPDLDTLLYTLSGLNDDFRGWGRKNETWTFMAALAALGGENWFQLGDGDLATHVERTRRLQAAESLSAVMDDFRRRLGIAARLVPMTDDRVRTRLETAEGWLDFQDYFVRLQCRPVISAIAFDGAAEARPNATAMAALADPKLRAVVICPSNPFISIEPILAVPGIRAAIRDCRAPVVAVSPIVGGKAVKGPTAKMMEELGLSLTSQTVSGRYDGLIDAMLVDEDDASTAADHGGVTIVQAPTLMNTLDDKIALAAKVLAVADAIRGDGA